MGLYGVVGKVLSFVNAMNSNISMTHGKHHISLKIHDKGERIKHSQNAFDLQRPTTYGAQYFRWSTAKVYEVILDAMFSSIYLKGESIFIPFFFHSFKTFNRLSFIQFLKVGNFTEAMI